MRLACLLAVACLLSSRAALAQGADVPPPPPPDVRTEKALLDVKSQLIYPKANFGIALYQDGRKLEMGLFLSNIDAVFGSFPEALETARTARTLLITGSIIYGVGMGVLVADLVLLIVKIASRTPLTGSEEGLYYGLAIGGGVVGIVGSLIIGAGGSKLVEAVNRHNFGILNRHLPQDKQFDVNRLLSSRPLQRELPLASAVTVWSGAF